MHKVTAEALESEGAEDIRDDYSGRGMYGKTTHAVVFADWSDVLKAITQVAYELGSGDLMFTEDEKKTVLADLRKTRYDSMGRSIIIY